MKKIFISILHFGEVKNTSECLRSLTKVDKSNFDLTILIIDNASKEKFYLDKNIKSNVSIKLIENERNLGFGEGHNIGIKYAIENGADYILTLNNDTTVEASFINELLNVIDLDEKVGIAVPKIYFAPGFEFHKNKYKDQDLGKVIWYAGGSMDWNNVIGYHRGVDDVDKGQYDQIEQTEIATGCCMIIKKELLEKVGPFDKKYFLYYEDADLSVRVKKNGYKIMYVPSSIIWHKNAEAAGGSGSALQDYYISRNRLLFGARYAPFRSRLSLIRESFKLVLVGRKWQKKGVLDFYFRKFGKGSFVI